MAGDPRAIAPGPGFRGVRAGAIQHDAVRREVFDREIDRRVIEPVEARHREAFVGEDALNEVRDITVVIQDDDLLLADSQAATLSARSRLRPHEIAHRFVTN
ncbi:MAG: hypothetical protein ABJB39_05795 [Chloroflexota bacterium]